VYQAYQKLYHSKVKQAVAERWPDEWKASDKYEEGKKMPAAPVAFYNKVAKELLAEEPQEVCDEVEAYRKQNPDEVDIGEEDADEDPDAKAERKRVAEATAFQTLVVNLFSCATITHAQLSVAPSTIYRIRF
jgi:hypothetical protein